MNLDRVPKRKMSRGLRRGKGNIATLVRASESGEKE